MFDFRSAKKTRSLRPLCLLAALTLSAACVPTDPGSTVGKTADMSMEDMTTPPAPQGCEVTEGDETSCDGEDNDCDGVSDEGCTCDFAETTQGVCPDGAIDPTSRVCSAPAEHEAEESACDGLDNDCDGVVDEGCACDFNGSTVGLCSSGRILDDGDCGRPNDYQGTETACDGLDNDCDGIIDGSCACAFEGKMAGVCMSASVDASTGACVAPSGYEAQESACDSVDNDCDGVVDEGCACNYKDQTRGVCRGSVRGASDGACAAPAAYEADESTCDGEDNDCDGSTDEGCGCAFMGSTLGVCGAGLTQAGGGCNAPPSFETMETTCDGADNDCDGVVDEGCACEYMGSSAGVCTSGQVGVADGACISPTTYQVAESTCDGLDNDCDGIVDEGCACDFNNVSVGACASGRINAASGSCDAPPTYQANESASCDGADNDCDGVVDEGCACEFSGLRLGVCGTATVDMGGQCAQPAAYEASESLCDMLDNDCDGVVDEGCPRAPVYGDVIITEFLPDPKTVLDENGEWFEIQNVSSDPIELKGLVFSDNTPTGRLTVAGSHVLQPGDFFVFGRLADPALNGGITVDYAQQEFLLNNNGDAIQILRNMNGSLVPIDQVVYDASWPDGVGKSAALKNSEFDANKNNVSSAWCQGSTPIGSGMDFGTPGAPNDCP